MSSSSYNDQRGVNSARVRWREYDRRETLRETLREEPKPPAELQREVREAKRRQSR